MKKSWNPLLSLIIIVVFIIGIISTKEMISVTDMLNEQITSQQAEIIRLKNIIKQQDKTIEEQLKIIEEKDKEIEDLRIIRNVRVSAYAPLDNKSGICADDTPTITATGSVAKRGIIAVDPDEIPYGTEVHVPGYGIASAEDTGYLICASDEIAIDILVDTYEEAMQWGVRYLDVILQ